MIVGSEPCNEPRLERTDRRDRDWQPSAERERRRRQRAGDVMADAQRTMDRAATPALAGVIVGDAGVGAVDAEDLAGCCGRRRYAGDEEAREDDVEDKRVRCDKRRRPAHTLPENEPPHLIPRFTRITAQQRVKIARRQIPSIAQQCCTTAI